MRSQEGGIYVGKATAVIAPDNTSFTGGWQGGLYQFLVVCGAFNSATVQLAQLASDGTTEVGLATALSANGVQNVYVPPGATLSVVIASATPTDNVYASLARIPSD